MKNKILYYVVLIVLGVSFGLWEVHLMKTYESVDDHKLISTVSYKCDAGRSINAEYYDGVVNTGKDGRPEPTGFAKLKLSDGRSMMLGQTISADGARYANSDDSIVFWSKGQGLIFMEDNKQTYTNCTGV